MSRTAKSNAKKVRNSGQVCHYCGDVITAATTTADHIVPRAIGGTDAQWNLVSACQPCNLTKGDQLPNCVCDFCARALELWRNPELPRPEPPQRAWPPRSKDWLEPRGHPLPVGEVTKLQSWLDRHLPGQTV